MTDISVQLITNCRVTE